MENKETLWGIIIASLVNVVIAAFTAWRSKKESDTKAAIESTNVSAKAAVDMINELQERNAKQREDLLVCEKEKYELNLKIVRLAKIASLMSITTNKIKEEINTAMALHAVDAEKIKCPYYVKMNEKIIETFDTLLSKIVELNSQFDELLNGYKEKTND